MLTPLAPLFARVAVPDDAAGGLTDLERRGSVVYVMRTAGFLNASFVAWLARRLALAPVRAVIGLAGLFRLFGPGRGTTAALLRAVRARGSGLIFLRRPSPLRLRGVGARDPFPDLVELQRTLDHPVYLVPVLFVWSRRAQHLRPSVMDRLIGSSEAPGALTTLVSFLRSHRRAFVRFGRPIDLQAAVADRAADAAPALARRVRGVLAYHLGRETRAILGPPFKEAARVREEVLRDRGLRAAVADVAAASARAPADVEAEAEGYVREIAARMTPALFEPVRPAVSWIVNRLYDGIEVDDAGFDGMRRAATSAPLVLCPSHKSHMDYVILTYLLYVRGMLPPHVAAGINMAFWPFGNLARRCGGFFIRRSFRGDRVYAATLKAYVRHLLRDGFVQEFFIEGGRSRTGKVLSPKMGLLAMEVDAWVEGTVDDVLFAPVAIDYEKLAEARSHARELGGAAKSKETLRGLVGARKMLRHRHGRIYIQFDEPISLRAVAEARGGVPADEDARRALVQHLANRIAHGIASAATVTPTGLAAAALLADEGPVTASVVARRIGLLRLLAADEHARFSAALAGAPDDPREGGAIGEALALFERDGLLRMTAAATAGTGEAAWTAVTDRRSELDFYRNNVIHRFVAPAVVAAAWRAAGQGAPIAAVREGALFLSRLLKLEFVYRSDAPFDALFAETHALLDRHGIPERDADMAFLAAALRPYLEAYGSAAALAGEGGAPQDAASFARAAFERARADRRTGRLRLPEAVSRSSSENAAAWLDREGLLADAAGARALAARIALLLDRAGAARVSAPGAS